MPKRLLNWSIRRDYHGLDNYNKYYRASPRSRYHVSATDHRLDASKASPIGFISTDSMLNSRESDLEVEALKTFFETKMVFEDVNNLSYCND